MMTQCTKDYMHPSEHETEEHPFRTEMHIPPDEWGSNALTFASVEDAKKYGQELMGRWFVPDAYRVVDTRTEEVVE